MLRHFAVAVRAQGGSASDRVLLKCLLVFPCCDCAPRLVYARQRSRNLSRESYQCGAARISMQVREMRVSFVPLGEMYAPAQFSLHLNFLIFFQTQTPPTVL